MADKSSPRNEPSAIPSSLQNAQDAIEALYQYRDGFFEKFGIEKAPQKSKMIEEERDKTLALLENASDDAKSSAWYHMLRGKALNVTPDFDQNALDCLAKAVKLDPKLMEAWIHLGECHWKKSDVTGAHNCFLGALNHGKDKRALRNLSMVLRQLGSTPEEKAKYIQEGVEKAKEALALDVKDGISWFILGNSYLTQFFSSNQDPKILQLCSNAYSQAEKDGRAKNDPDLHFNRSIVHKYNEEFQTALEGFSRASALDPTWEEPKQKEQQLLKYLANTKDLIETKGKIKGKKLQTVLSSIKDSDLGVYSGGEYKSSKGKTIKLESKNFDHLVKGSNPESVVLGKVIGSVMSEDAVPFTFGMVDRTGTCIAVSVYNIAPENGVKIGDAVAIPEPWLEEMKVSHKDKNIEFRSIRVDSPVVLVINGRKQGMDSVAPTKLYTSVMSQ